MLLFGLVACEKDKDEVVLQYPATYHSIQYRTSSQVRLFSREGEIVDWQVIDRFVEKNGGQFLLPYNFMQNISPAEADSVHIISASAAKGKRVYNYSWQNYSIRKSGELVEFISTDTSTLVWTPKEEAMLRKLQQGFYRHDYAYRKEQPLPTATGYSTMLKVVEKQVAYLKSDQLHFPLLNYLLVNTNPGYGGNRYSRSNIYNELKSQPDYSQLSQNDTLALQAYELIYTKE